MRLIRWDHHRIWLHHVADTIRQVNFLERPDKAMKQLSSEYFMYCNLLLNILLIVKSMDDTNDLQ